MIAISKTFGERLKFHRIHTISINLMQIISMGFSLPSLVAQTSDIQPIIHYLLLTKPSVIRITYKITNVFQIIIH